MTRQQAPGLHLPDGGKIQAAVEFVLPDRTIKPVDPADQVSWNQDHICVLSPAGRDYPTGRVRCHFPLRCSQAACSHLPKYDEASAEQIQTLEEQAKRLLGMAALPQCQQCNGLGLNQVTENAIFPGLAAVAGQDTVEFTANTVCTCVDLSRLPNLDHPALPSLN